MVIFEQAEGSVLVFELCRACGMLPLPSPLSRTEPSSARTFGSILSGYAGPDKTVTALTDDVIEGHDPRHPYHQQKLA
tara:strand:- start:722 stop:955 length:234 start_codon:yes stop_codon:yes gene_type:complete